MTIKIAQLIVTRDIQKNLEKVLEVLNTSSEGEWVLFPEGMISGYYPEEETYLEQLSYDEIIKVLETIHAKVREKRCLCIVGSAIKEKDRWFNASIFMDSSQQVKYYKNNLATLDRKHFQQGNTLDVYSSQGVTFGIQMCRELVFPEQWKLLKQKGAQVIFHINNSIKEKDIIRSHLLYARAFENQYFVCSVNNADKLQTMPSFIISPIGETLYQSIPQQESVQMVKINLSQVDDTYLNQERTDLVQVVEK